MNQATKTVLYLITKANWGGAQRYVFDLATNLPHDVCPVVAYGLPAQAGQGGILAEKLRAANIGTRAVPPLGRDVAVLSDIASFFQILKLIRETKPDVVHLNSSKAAALGALGARLYGVKKIIFTVHGWPFNEKRNFLVRAAIYLISWFTALLSTSVIVVSRSDETQGKNMWLVGKKIRYIPIGIEPPEFLSREEASAKLSISTTSPRIVTIAELTKNKGIRYAVEAMSELKRRSINVEYFLVGDGEAREALQRLARTCDVDDRIHFLAFVPDASKYLKAFDVFLLPSIKEGMPYVLLEAAAANLPIITTTVVNPDMLERYEQVRAVPPEDPDAIASAITEEMKAQREQQLLRDSGPFPLSEMVRSTTALY